MAFRIVSLWEYLSTIEDNASSKLGSLTRAFAAVDLLAINHADDFSVLVLEGGPELGADHIGWDRHLVGDELGLIEGLADVQVNDLTLQRIALFDDRGVLVFDSLDGLGLDLLDLGGVGQLASIDVRDGFERPERGGRVGDALKALQKSFGSFFAFAVTTGLAIQTRNRLDGRGRVKCDLLTVIMNENGLALGKNKR